MTTNKRCLYILHCEAEKAFLAHWRSCEQCKEGIAFADHSLMCSDGYYLEEEASELFFESRKLGCESLMCGDLFEECPNGNVCRNND